MAGTFSVVEKTGRTWIWVYTHAIQALKEDKVSTGVSTPIGNYSFSHSLFSTRLFRFGITTQTKTTRSSSFPLTALTAESTSRGKFQAPSGSPISPVGLGWPTNLEFPYIKIGWFGSMDPFLRGRVISKFIESQTGSKARSLPASG